MALTKLGEGAIDAYIARAINADPPLLMVPPEAVDGKLWDTQTHRMTLCWRRPGLGEIP